MGVVANSLGMGAELQIEDKTWTVAPWSEEIKGFFERYLERHMIETHKRLEAYMTSEKADRQLKDLMSDIGLGLYSFGTEFMQKALDTPVHVSYLVFLFLKKNHPEVTRQDAAKMVKDHYRDVIKAINVANSDPNPKVTETKVTTQPPSSSSVESQKPSVS